MKSIQFVVFVTLKNKIDNYYNFYVIFAIQRTLRVEVWTLKSSIIEVPLTSQESEQDLYGGIIAIAIV